MPAANVATYLQLADETASHLTYSHQEWTGFLRTASRLYKYPYHEQLMIYAQRPDATACAEYDLWNNKMRRYVRRGSKGIALVDNTGGQPKLRYVFDIADTGKRENSVEFQPWALTEENAQAAALALERGYDVPASEGLERQSHAVANQLAQNYWLDHQQEIIGIVDGSFLEGYDEFNVGAAFRKAASVSLEYALLSRCGLDPDARFEHEDFLPIFDWNTPEAVAVLGTAVSEMSEEVLRTVEISVRNYERSHEHERDHLSAERRLSDPQPDHQPNGASHRQIRQDAQDVSASEPSNVVQFPRRDGQAVPASAGDRGRGEQPLGTADAHADGAQRRDGATESQQPDEMGRADEQPESASRGNDTNGTDLQLTGNIADEQEISPSSAKAENVQLSFFPTEESQIAQIDRAESDTPSALAFAAQRFSQEEIDRVLINGTNGSTGKNANRYHILTAFQKSKPMSEIAAMLPREFVGGRGFENDHGKVCAWYGEDGIHLTRGSAARYVVTAQVIPWKTAAERIGELLEQGQYATYEELALAPTYERKELAQSLWYMRQDLDEEGVEYLITIGEKYTGHSFDDAVTEIAALMEQPESRRALTEEVRTFVQAYEQDRSLLRFHFHKPVEILERMEELELPRRDYESVIPEIPQETSFITQDEIDVILASGSSVSGGKGRIYAFFQAHHDERERIQFLKREYGIGGRSPAIAGSWGSSENHDGKGIRFEKSGCEDVQLAWNAVAKQIDRLITAGRYIPKEEWGRANEQRRDAEVIEKTPAQEKPDDGDMSEFFAIDKERVRERLAERGIVNGKLVDPDKLANDPFIKQVEADAERLAAEQDVSYERFSVIETDKGYAIWDDLHDGYYVDEEGVTEEFPGEWQAESYLEEIRKAVQAKEAAEWDYIERAKVEPSEPQTIVAPASDAPALPYSVGDTLYLEEGKPFIIEQIGSLNVRLRDLSLRYPIVRAESKENLARLLKRHPQPEHAAPAAHEDARQTVRSETVAVYPAEQNHLPYDVVIQRMHFGEPVQAVAETGRAPIPAVQPRAENYRITDDHLGEGGAKTKYSWNVEAIRTLQTIEAENRQATPDEQETLSRYVGWGGISQAFDEKNESWAKEYAELKELLSQAEYASARASTLNAHYTSPTVIRAIYDTIGRMGFTTGNVLEPACGVGNFFGMLPESMAASNLYGTELDSITGRIAKQLYPQANIAIQGFEKTDRRDFYDLAVGNVPFGHYKVPDRAYDKLNFNIHDYFFAKAIDQVRPGGVIAFITSKGTMDKQSPEVRKYIARRAELLGAVRLPNNAFKANAGTEVTSDILFLQKRDRAIDIEPDWVHLGQTEDGVPVNSYFADHPEMVLGKMAWDDSMYGNHRETACLPTPGAELAEQLAAAMEHITGQITEAELPDLGDGEVIDMSIPADPNTKNFSYAIVDGDVYYRENSRMVRPELNATAKERVKGLVALRDCVQSLIALQMDAYTPDAEITEAQTELNRLYDVFSAKYGLINSRGNANAFSDDNSYYLLCSLEILDENGALERKADMFTKRTIRPARVVEHVDSASEALAVSIAEKARVDMPYMEKLTGKPEETLVGELKNAIFRLPALADAKNQPRYATADEYLSGNIREKLVAARNAAETSELFSPNVQALEQAMPKPLDASEIDVRLGATWIDKSYIQQFMEETLETPFYMCNKIRVNYSPVTAEWNISNKGTIRSNDVTAYSTYGTEYASAYKILEDTLNLRDVRIYDTVRDVDGNEKRVLNKNATTLAQQKQQAIKDAFQDWVWQDADRRRELSDKYNELFNSTRPREYDGSHITFSGMNPEIALRPHQRDAIAHILYGGNTLLAHEVGAGKTFEMVAAVMESKRLGLCNKALFAVPNHLTEQWSSEFLRLYPSANILVATKKDFETKNRKKFCARIATGDYDAIIMGHSQFERIPVSVERQERLLDEQIMEIEEGIEELKSANAERFTIKQAERTKKMLEARLKKLNDSERKDDVVTFEQLGVDRLYVDEAHNYKNCFLYTKMRNVAGLAATDAQKSSDMLMKCRYMDEITGGRGTVFATGTPVSNSMTELYTMQRYLQHDALKRNGMSHFDCWASTFGETVTSIELAPEGTGYRARTRFARFFNLPELMTLFKETADIKTADVLNLPTPETVYHNVVAQPTEIQKELVQKLSERAADVHSGNVEPNVDNMLKITSDGRKLGLDQRLINPMLPDEPGSKVNLCVENIARIYREGDADKLTQLVFCDLSTPKGDGSFTVYDDIRQKLIAKGIPESEIAFIHEANTEVRKKELFAKVRSGQVRVLMGSTSKMGAGTNVQDRLVALHDLDCPWRPGDLEQRKGRIVRQGNKNPQVHIFRYVTEGTFDSYLWQTVENKQKFISQIMTSKSPVRSCEDVDATALSYAEIKALCAGNPLIKEKMNLDTDVAKLKLLKAAHQSQQFKLEDRLLKTFPKQIEQSKQAISGFTADMATAKAHGAPQGKFAGMTVLGRELIDKEAAGTAILNACKAVKDMNTVPLGSYRGFEMSLSLNSFGSDYLLTLKGEMAHPVSLGTDPRGNILRIDNALSGIPDRMNKARDELEDLLRQQDAAKQEIGKPFPQEAELREKSARLAELDAELNMEASKGKENNKENSRDSDEGRADDEAELDGDEPLPNLESEQDNEAYRYTPRTNKNAMEER